MVWTGEPSEKLQHMIPYKMKPQLFESGIIKKHTDPQNLI